VSQVLRTKDGTFDSSRHSTLDSSMHGSLVRFRLSMELQRQGVDLDEVDEEDDEESSTFSGRRSWSTGWTGSWCSW
jgi:hypothetical protein